MDRSLLLIAHILLLVAWLGIDVGVFTSSFFIRRRGLSPDARTELRRVMRGLDLAPRLSLVLTMPVALGLADATGLATIPTAALSAVTVLSLLWVAGMVWAFRRVDVLGRPTRQDARAAAIFTRADLALRIAAIIGFGGAGFLSLVGTSEIFRADFVALKALLFASTVTAGLRIRSSARPFGPALRTVVTQGEDEAQLRIMDASMRRVYPAVLYIWGSLVVMTMLGVLRPTVT